MSEVEKKNESDMPELLYEEAVKLSKKSKPKKAK